ncbi:MAG: hypothetical protein SFU56_18835 [Capsulimonadales bacterium]|nr:hypothetical protein [Capsulimonadales bacterium]
MQPSSGVELKPGAALALTVVLLAWIIYFLKPIVSPDPADAKPKPRPSVRVTATAAPDETADSKIDQDMTLAETAPHGEPIDRLPDGKGVVTLENGEQKLRTHEPTRLRVESSNDYARITVLQAEPEQWWIPQAYCAYPHELKVGETLYLHLRARSATENPVWVILEEGSNPYRKNFSRHLQLTRAWKDYAFKIPVKVPDVADRTRIRIQAGEKVGTIDISHLEIRRL